MSSLMEMLAEMGGNLDRDDAPASDGLPEAQIVRLKEVAARIAEGNPFKVGDVVTVRKDAPVKGAGKPRIVIAIDPDAPLYQGDPGEWTNSVRRDVTVISVNHGDLVPHSIPFWMLEVYAR